MEKSESHGQIARNRGDLAGPVALCGMPSAGTTLMEVPVRPPLDLTMTGSHRVAHNPMTTISRQTLFEGFWSLPSGSAAVADPVV